MNNWKYNRYTTWKDYLLIIASFLPFFYLSILKADNPISDIAVIEKVSSNIFSSKSFRRQPIDDTLSKTLFKEYLDTLDPSKIYFTQEDVKGLSRYEKELDNQILKGDTTAAFQMYDLLVKRMKEYQSFANAMIDAKIDFSKDETFLFDRKDAERPTAAEQKELWRKKIKYDLLAYKLMDKAMKEEKIEDKTEKEQHDVAELWKKTPEERLKKRIASAIINLEKKREIDKLEFFLGTLARIYDPHSAYMAPSSAEDFDISMKNSLVGIGAVLSWDDGYTKINSIIKGGPADKDGRLKAEDRIVAVAQGNQIPVDVIDMPLNDVVHLIRGEKGTIVRLHVMKGRNGLGGIPEIITIKRDKVELQDQNAQSEIREVTIDGEKKKVGIIKLPSFYIDFKGAAEHKPDYRSATRDVKNILNSFSAKQVDGVIIDLRQNGGGSLQESIQLTGLFIDKGPVVQVKDAEQSLPEVDSDNDGKIYYNGPLIVMISRFSASAAEIFAAAIQDYGRGIIVGDRHSHGKGTVQTIWDLNRVLKYWGFKSNPGNVKVTIAKFYRINGESTQVKGVTPDLIYPNFTDTMEIGEKYLPHVLPWDTIEPANYTKKANLAPLIKDLRTKSEARREKDPAFEEHRRMIALYDKIRERKESSLNEEKRWKEYMADKKVLDKELSLLSPAASDGKEKKQDREDLFMDETVKVMSDWFNSEHVDTSPAVKK